MDPRAPVIAGFVLALALIGLSAALLARSADEARRLVAYLDVSIHEPRGYLGHALEANTAGQTDLQRAVVATGDQRNEWLSRSITAGQTASEAWTSYRAGALGLPGEAELAATYERDYEAGRALAGSVLVPILQSNTPGVLPSEQVAGAEQNRKDLIALQALYASEERSALRELDQQQARSRGAIVAGAAALGLLVLASFALAFGAARRAVEVQRERAGSAQLAEFEARLIRALEFADSDDDAFRVASRAVVDTLPEAVVSIVVADASREILTPIAAAPACGVQRVEHCRAARAAVPLQFSDSNSLDTCPVLAAGATSPCAVTCIPLSVAGMPAAVVQLTGPVGQPPEMGVAIPLIVRRLGDRITTMRAFAQFQLQAAHDPLTGLLNRRSFEEAVGRLTADETPYAVGYADLDHFKLLNDVHGHDVGDRALRAFAVTMKATLRPDDLVGRWGGEEFVIVLPDCDRDQAVAAMGRVRTQMASEALEGANVAVTVSVGVAVRDRGESFDEVVARADQALRTAKADGRDRVTLWKPPVSAAAAAATT